MPSRNTYHLTWVSLTLDEGCLLTAAPPRLERGAAPFGPPAPAQPPLLRHTSKVMSLLLNMLCRLVITFLPRSKRLLISWLQSASVMISEPRKIKSDTVSTVSPSISHEVMGLDAMIFVF